MRLLPRAAGNIRAGREPHATRVHADDTQSQMRPASGKTGKSNSQRSILLLVCLSEPVETAAPVLALPVKRWPARRDGKRKCMREMVKKLIGPLIGWTDEAWTRVVMNRTTLEWVRALDTGRMDALQISGEYWKKKAPYRSYRSAWYPEYDVCEKPLPETFDLVFAEQVFEHLLYPARAVRNIYQMVRAGGYFLLTVPFLFRVHANPTDCTRWTPQGLAYFLEEGGFSRDKMRVGAWGNRACVKASLAGRNYCRRLHSLENEPDYPVVVWALAQKGEAS